MFAGLKNQFIAKSRNEYPRFMIIGTQKAGTTTLFDMLESIPGFCGANVKEIGYFVNDVYYNRGKDWYLQQFSKCEPGSIKFEATPGYLYHKDVPDRIFSFNKATKFIVILREPSARCYSAWNMFKSFNRYSAEQTYEVFIRNTNPPVREAIRDLLFTSNFPSFKDAVLDDIERYESNSEMAEPSFVRRGIYCEQIENYLEYFSLSDFLFLEQRELGQTNLVLKKISNFLDVEIDETLIESAVKSNSGNYEDGETGEDGITEVMSMLKAFYRPHNEKLFRQIGIHYDWNEQ